MSEYLEKFQRFLAYNNPGTAKTYTLFLRDFLGFLKKPVEQANALDFTDWFIHLETEKHWSRRTVGVGAAALKRFYKAIGHPGIASMIPVPDMGAVRERAWLEEQQVLKLIGKIPVLCVGYDLALRIGEVQLLQVETLNRKTGGIEVVREKHKGRPNKYPLTLDPWCLEILRQHIDQNQIKRGPIFTCSVMTVNTIFRQRRAMMNLDETVTFHCLRHSRITHVAMHELETKGTVDIVSLAKFAGHSSTDTTLGYIHLASKYLAFLNIPSEDRKRLAPQLASQFREEENKSFAPRSRSRRQEPS